MAHMHSVEIIWDELMDAFTSVQSDRVYFLDRHTGEVFFVPANLEDEEFWRQIETNDERFLEIPGFDYGMERQLIKGFIGAIEDSGLKEILGGSMAAGMKPYGKLSDILSFFPDERDRLVEMKNEFLASRVKTWLKANNLFPESETMRILRI